MLPYPSILAVSRSHVWCSMPTCAESIVPSTPWSQLQGTRDTHQYEWTSFSGEGQLGEGRHVRVAEPHPRQSPRLAHGEVDDAHARRELLGPDELGRRLDHAAGHVDLPAVIEAAHAVPLDAPERQRGAAVGAELVEEADPAVLRAEGDVVLAEEAHLRRCLPVHEMRRERERDPVVLAHEPAHRCVAVDASQQLVLRSRDHGASDGCRGQPIGSELEVQPLHTAEHVEVRVLVAAGAGRAVRLLRDPDVGHAIEQALGADARLGPGERSAGAAVDAGPERRGAGASSDGPRRNSPGASNWRGSRFAAPGISITVVPAGIGTPPIFVATRASRNVHWIGGSSRRHSSMKFGMRVALVAQQLLELGALADQLEHLAEQARRGLLARREQIGGDQHDVADLGQACRRETSRWPSRSSRRCAGCAGALR